MNRRKAVALLGLILLGFLLISCFQGGLKVSNTPKTLHGQSDATTENNMARAAEGTPTPRSGGNGDNRREPPIAASTPSSPETVDDQAAAH